MDHRTPPAHTLDASMPNTPANGDVPGHLEPRTPPRRHAHAPATPATPQFGSFYDHLTPTRPGKARPAASPVAPPSARKRHFLSTPRQTPHRNKIVKHAQLKAPVFKLVDEEQPDHVEQIEQQARAEEDPGSMTFTIPCRRTRSAPSDLESGASTLPCLDGPHPHQDRPPDVPGMWYVFRGRKVFRPFADGEEPLKPITLFKDDIAQREAERDSEDDTEVEW